MNTPAQPAHTWIAQLHGHLDGLERALLQSDAPAVERASATVQAALQQAPRTLALRGADADALQSAALRFTQLRAATLRAILRAGAWELSFKKDVPVPVIVTEYVDIARAFFEEDEPKIVNAVLDRLARKYRSDPAAKQD